jgi:hypothetical protein
MCVKNQSENGKGRFKHRKKDNIKMVLMKQAVCLKLDSCGSGYSPTAASCKRSNNLLRFTQLEINFLIS